MCPPVLGVINHAVAAARTLRRVVSHALAHLLTLALCCYLRCAVDAMNVDQPAPQQQQQAQGQQAKSKQKGRRKG